MVPSLTLPGRISVPDDVMVRELDGESVFLNLASNQYFGLDPVGTDMWRALTATPSIQEAFDRLQAEYDVEPETLRRDLTELVEKLAAHGLVRIED